MSNNNRLDTEIFVVFPDIIYEYETIDDENSEAMFIESRHGKTLLQFNGYRYRKMYKTKNGVRWNCSSKNTCSAFVYLNDEDEIIMTSKHHNHPPPNRAVEVYTEQNPRDTPVVITSRKGKEMLLFRKYTYRKQYAKADRNCRWVCSTKKNCLAVVFTDANNHITSAIDTHIHDPPKYYLNPNHLLGAIREPIVLETD